MPENVASEQKNVLGEPLEACCFEPQTGFDRDGYCRTDNYDHGKHVVCAIVSQEFLDYSYSKGNDLITPNPAYGFPGLKAGDGWCLCISRWKEAFDAGVAPPIKLSATQEKALEVVSIDDLSAMAV